MERRIELKVKERTEVGGKRPRRMRRQGLIPGVLYGDREGALPLMIERQAQEREVTSLHENQILGLRLGGKKNTSPQLVIVKALQRHYLTGEMLHVDFQGISLTEKLTVTVPLVEAGEPVGVTRDGGILEHVMREVEIKCLPDQIPENIEVDVSSLEIGDSIRVGEIHAGEGVEILTEPEIIAFTLAAPITEEEVEKMEAEAGMEAEAAPAVAGEEEEEREEGKEEGEKKAAGEAEKAPEDASGKPEEKGGKEK